jgi:hypothetical protein
MATKPTTAELLERCENPQNETDVVEKLWALRELIRDNCTSREAMQADTVIRFVLRDGLDKWAINSSDYYSQVLTELGG